MAERKPQNQDKYIVRLPDGMREQLKKAAEESGRSLNSEIVFRLGNSLKNREMEDAGYSINVPNGLTLHDDLNWLLINSADGHQWSVREEIEQRLYDSFANPDELLQEFSWRYLAAQDRLEKAEEIINYLTPSERLFLEDRIESIKSGRRSIYAQHAAEFNQDRHIVTKDSKSGDE